MERGKNKDFVINAVLMILNKNYQIELQDPQEIDSSLSIGENISILKDRYSFNNCFIDYL